MEAGPVLPIAIAAAITGLSGFVVFWSSPKEHAFYTCWVSKRLWTVRCIGAVGHAAAGAAGAIGAHHLGWQPFDETQLLNGLAYAGAVEATIRANVAGLQVSAPGRVWSIAELVGGSIGAKLDEHAALKIADHLDAAFPTDPSLAAKTVDLLGAARYLDSGKALALTQQFDQARDGNAASRSLLLEFAVSLAAVVRWRKT